jgi:hypothetical protein
MFFAENIFKNLTLVPGSYEYIGPDGEVYTVDWEADENGYRASGAGLDTLRPTYLHENCIIVISIR